MKRSKILFWLLVVFTVVNFFDVLTAMFILPGESNPLYILTGSKAFLWVLKFVVIGLCWWIYYKAHVPKNHHHFTFVYALVVGSLLIALGVYSNVMGILNPQLIDAAATVSDGEKIEYYFTLVGFLYFLPYILSIVSFIIYDKSRKHVKIDGDKDGS